VLLSVVERRQHWAAQWTYLQTWLLSGSGSHEDLLAGYLHSSVFSDEVLGVASRDFHGIYKTSGIARRSYLSVTYESRWPVWERWYHDAESPLAGDVRDLFDRFTEPVQGPDLKAYRLDGKGLPVSPWQMSMLPFAEGVYVNPARQAVLVAVGMSD